jgi:hypothetical protein
MLENKRKQAWLTNMCHIELVPELAVLNISHPVLAKRLAFRIGL